MYTTPYSYPIRLLYGYLRHLNGSYFCAHYYGHNTLRLDVVNGRIRTVPFDLGWYDYVQGNIFNCFIEFEKSTQLTVVNSGRDYLYAIITIDIRRILSIAQVYHLEITGKMVFTGELIKLVNILPELDTSKIHSLSLG